MTSAAGLEVGQIVAEQTFALSRDTLVRYAGASGDFNPIHHDEGFATSAGFPTVFSIGMYQAALLATFATDWLGADSIRRFTVRFQEQVWPDDVLTCSGTVTAVEPDGDGTRVEVYARREEDTVASGEVGFLIAPYSPERSGRW